MAWNFYNEHKGQITFKPPYDEPRFSDNSLYRKAFQQKPEDQLWERTGGYIDVRDAAQAHVLLREKQAG
ncbi:hypothetical protein CALCODRAFT_503345 [Calocera cornea HHB12733]|uniref:Uncharacterized protein n=1 Tax=Calocera cornea HHB12733 TaxID=1353952 RepID=A0A165CX46_9BASI|nr:hypothetical protein CALCODRAFT_503345 [Calocera cornea HHB12733]